MRQGHPSKPISPHTSEICPTQRDPSLLTISYFTTWWIWNYFHTIRVFAERWPSSPFVSGNHRRIGVKRTFKDHLVQPSCSSRFTYRRLHRIMSGWVLSVSGAGDYTASLGYLFQCSVTLKHFFFLILRWNILCFSLCLLPGTTEMSLLPSSWLLLLRYLYALKWHYIKLSILKSKA